MEGSRRPVVVRLEVVLLLELRAVRAHDRDGPSNELFDQRKIFNRGLDVRDDVRGCQQIEHLVEVNNERVDRHLRLLFWGRWHTFVELLDESTELFLLLLVDARNETGNRMLE